MMQEFPLFVSREIAGEFQLVGAVVPSAAGSQFLYAEEYATAPNSHAISSCLPLQSDPFSLEETKAFFEGLLPEGPMRRSLANAAHSDVEDYLALLSRLNLESVGALIFYSGNVLPGEAYRYEPIDFTRLEEFARFPRAFALQMGMASRLSLAGAQSKIGLLHQGENMREGWFSTVGIAPSSHIVKAGDGSFPHQTVNEALCLTIAKKLDYDVANCSLIRIDGQEPLLCVERFDRLSDAHGVVHRLHQEDFCQATGLASEEKYEPTDGNYLNRMANLVNLESSNGFGDRVFLFDSILLDWALGNCDNHLKNRSILWSSDWRSKKIAPLYDLTCTTFYPGMDREMGVSLSQSRRIDDVDFRSILASAKSVGVPESIASSLVSELADKFDSVVVEACDEISSQGFFEVEKIGKHIRSEWKKKLKKLA